MSEKITSNWVTKLTENDVIHDYYFGHDTPTSWVDLDFTEIYTDDIKYLGRLCRCYRYTDGRLDRVTKVNKRGLRG